MLALKSVCDLKWAQFVETDSAVRPAAFNCAVCCSWLATAALVLLFALQLRPPLRAHLWPPRPRLLARLCVR